MAQLLGSDIEQHVFATRIIFADRLSEVPARGRQLALGAAELLEEEVRQARVRSGNADGVLQPLVVYEH
jgi:hypothetical protein